MCALILSTFLILRGIQRDNQKRLYVKRPSFLSNFNKTWIFWTDFWRIKKSSITNFIKTRPVRAELFHAGGRTAWRDDANSRFSRFCEKRLKTTRSCNSVLDDFVISVIISIIIIIIRRRRRYGSNDNSNDSLLPRVSSVTNAFLARRAPRKARLLPPVFSMCD